jgi:hypothetical protein
MINTPNMPRGINTAATLSPSLYLENDRCVVYLGLAAWPTQGTTETSFRRPVYVYCNTVPCSASSDGAAPRGVEGTTTSTPPSDVSDTVPRQPHPVIDPCVAPDAPYIYKYPLRADLSASFVTNRLSLIMHEFTRLFLVDHSFD